MAITTANSVIAMTVEALYPTAQRIQGYAADDAFTTEAVENGEYSMGIDGELTAGYVYNPSPLTITLQADSPSLSIFERIVQYENTNRAKLRQSVTISLPALGKRYDFVKGFMQSYKAPAGKKTLEPGVIVFTFQSMQVSPL